MLDVVTKHVFAVILIRCLEAAGYFEYKDSTDSKEMEPDREQKGEAQTQLSKELHVIGT